MSPSQTIIRTALALVTVADETGRKLVIRRPTSLDTLRLFKAAGPVLSQNTAWLSMAELAFSVCEIEGVPVPTPATEAQIEALVDRLGDAGLAAISTTLNHDDADRNDLDQVGNLPGTPS